MYGSYGGLPYLDLVNCFEYLKDLPGIDLGNAIAAGGSYGGYMINWLNGQPLGRKVCTSSHVLLLRLCPVRCSGIFYGSGVL